MRNWRLVEAGSSGERMALALLPTLVGAVVFGTGLFMWGPVSCLLISLAIISIVAWGLSRAERGSSTFVRELRGHMGFVLEHAPVVVWSLDEKGVYTFLRGQGLRELNLTPAEVIGLNYFDVNGDHPELVEFARRALAGAAFSAEMPVMDRWFSTTYLPLQKEGESAGFIAVSLDITERIQAEREAGIAREQLEAALAARDDFLSIASHELKTPLTTLKLRAQTIRRGLDHQDPRALSPEKIRSFVEQIDKQTSRLGRLVEDMLDMSRIRTGKLTMEPEAGDLEEIVSEAVEKIRPQFEAAACPLSFSRLGSALPVSVDKLRIDQVVTNFLTNALRYGRGNPVRVEAGAEGESAVVRVIDQGMGVAPENQRKIFNRFERAVSANEVSGLGLGLYISQQIVAAHGGEIRLQSKVGEGSTFELRLPMAAAASGPVVPAPELRASA